MVDTARDQLKHPQTPMGWAWVGVGLVVVAFTVYWLTIMVGQRAEIPPQGETPTSVLEPGTATTAPAGPTVGPGGPAGVQVIPGEFEARGPERAYDRPTGDTRRDPEEGGRSAPPVGTP